MSEQVIPLTGVTVNMVRDTLGASTTNISALCKSNLINRWSECKPVKWTGMTIDYKDEQGEEIYHEFYSSVRYGFTNPVEITGLTKSGDIIVFPNTGTPSGMSTWVYSPPGNGDKCRLGDFRFYTHNANPPDQMSGVTFDCGSIIRMLTPHQGMTTTNFEGNMSADWKPITGSTYQNSKFLEGMNLKWGKGDSEVVGNLTYPVQIPLNGIYSGATASESNTRIGLLVKCNSKWHLMTSEMPLHLTNEPRFLQVNFSTASNLCYEIIQSSVKTFDTIPCLVFGAQMSSSGTTESGVTYYNHTITGATKILCMPTGQGVLTMKINPPAVFVENVSIAVPSQAVPIWGSNSLYAVNINIPVYNIPNFNPKYVIAKKDHSELGTLNAFLMGEIFFGSTSGFGMYIPIVVYCQKEDGSWRITDTSPYSDGYTSAITFNKVTLESYLTGSTITPATDFRVTTYNKTITTEGLQTKSSIRLQDGTVVYFYGVSLSDSPTIGLHLYGCSN